MTTEEKGPQWQNYAADQIEVERLCRVTWGDKSFESIHERGSRVGEEGIETMQACGVDHQKAHKIVDMVYDRPRRRPRTATAGSRTSTSAA